MIAGDRGGYKYNTVCYGVIKHDFRVLTPVFPETGAGFFSFWKNQEKLVRVCRIKCQKDALPQGSAA
jgi:hypothetical protein